MENILETKSCRMCSANFDVTDADQVFYDKLEVPRPTCCPNCRSQSRQAWQNQINLFKRKCDATGKDIISVFPPEYEGKVFTQEYHGSDNWDPLSFGRDYDFNRPFFEQFSELEKVVPKPNLSTNYLQDENSEYTNHAGMNKNCYMIFDSDENRDTMYSYGTNGSHDCMDCYRTVKNQLCYENVDTKNCYHSYFTYNSENCSDCIFINNCIGCKNCIYCSNLNQKEYHIFNKPVPKEQYEEIVKELGNYEYLMDKLNKFHEFRLTFPQKFIHGFHNEKVSGDYLVHCKNAINCYDSMNIWDGRYCNQVFINARDCMDCDEVGDEAEKLYQCGVLAFNNQRSIGCTECFQQNTDLHYCSYCYTCKNLFGCISLRKKQYCILNKQYTQEEYEALLPRIIEHMKSTGDYGEFLPPSMSYFGYNLTKAQTFFPLTKEQAEAKGFRWYEQNQKEYQPQTYQIPSNIKDVPDEITNEILACTDCGRNYKVIEAELLFYRKANLPIPRKCFYCRHQDRTAFRTHRYLHDRQCQKCNAEIKTAYAEERPEIVYCEKCYLDSLQ